MSWTTFFDISLLQLTMVMMAPLIIACLGETIIERSGILNVGIEGIVTLGSVVGFLGTYYSGSAFFGCFLAAISGSLLTLVLGYFFHHFAGEPNCHRFGNLRPRPRPLPYNLSSRDWTRAIDPAGSHTSDTQNSHSRLDSYPRRNLFSAKWLGVHRICSCGCRLLLFIQNLIRTPTSGLWRKSSRRRYRRD